MMDILENIFNMITTLMGTQMFVQASKIIANVQLLFATGFCVYVLLMVFNFYQRGVDVSILEISKQAMGWVVVIALAFNASNYTSLSTAIYSLPETVSSWVSGTPLGANVYKAMIIALNQKISLMQAMSEEAGWGGKVTLGLCIVLSVILGYGGIVITLGMYLVAKASLALVLLLGPIFIGAMLFSSTRQYGMNWIGQCLNYALTCGLYTGVMIVQQKAFNLLELNPTYDEGIFSTTINVDVRLAFNFATSLLIISLVLIPVILNIPSIAATLTGGAGISGGMKSVSTMSIAKSPLNATNRVAKVGFSVAKGGVNLARKALKK